MTGHRASSGIGLRDEAMPHWLELFAAVAQTMTPCRVDPDPFTSDDPGQRADAAQACSGCRVRDACWDYADAQGETWGVWGGRDRSPGAAAPALEGDVA